MPKYLKVLFVILAIAPIAQFGTDIYVPALPDMVKHFSSTASGLQWTITIYLLSFSLGQPFIGPLSDTFGRKPILVIGLSIFLVGSILSMTANSLEMLYVARFIQGLGITSTAVMLKSIAADCFSGIDLVKVMTYALTAYGVGPIIAPVIGAHLTHHFGWRANFTALAFYSAILILLCFSILNETNKHLQSFDLKTIWANNCLVMKNKQFLFTFICGGVCFSTAYSFNVLAPFTIQGELHYSIIQYGYFSLMVGGAYLIGGLFNRFLIHHSSSKNIVNICLLVSFLVSLAMLLMSIFLPPSIITLIAPCTILVFICGIVNPHFFATGMSIFPKLAGTTGALSGFVMMFATAIVVFIISKLNTQSFVTLPAVLFVISWVSLSCYHLFIKESIK